MSSIQESTNVVDLLLQQHDQVKQLFAAVGVGEAR
jgi:hypothetical protein